MYIISQDRNFSLNASIVNWFHVDADHNVFARCGERNEVLLGKYKTSGRAIDAMIAITDAIEVGSYYYMPADNDTADFLPLCRRRLSGRASSPKFSKFCALYPGYLRGEYGVTHMAQEIGCSRVQVYNYIREVQAMKGATAAVADNV